MTSATTNKFLLLLLELLHRVCSTEPSRNQLVMKTPISFSVDNARFRKQPVKGLPFWFRGHIAYRKIVQLDEDPVNTVVNTACARSKTGCDISEIVSICLHGRFELHRLIEHFDSKKTVDTTTFLPRCLPNPFIRFIFGSNCSKGKWETRRSAKTT